MMRPPLEVLAAGAVSVAIASITISATPGIESAAALGVLLPPILAGAQARRVASERARGIRRPDESLERALLRTLIAFVIVLVVAALRLSFDSACADASGFAWLALGPFPGMLLATLVGEAVGRVVRRPRLAATLAVTIVLSAYVVVVREIYSTPAVYVFTLFAGHWPGPIYDESRTIPEAFVTYRIVSVFAIAALFLALRHGPRTSGPSRGTGLFLATASAIAFTAATANGASLGHRTDLARIDEALGGRVRGERCSLHVPSEMPRLERRRLLAECEAHVVDVERILHVHRRDPLEAFVYRSSEEKAELVGAGDTYVAKPWRGEVHVQRESFPHQVLRHEIVHVIAAERAPWPFRVSGSLGGLWMNPGLVEGIAVAVSWEPRDELTPDEWSLAMLELGRLPRARSLFGAGFLAQGAGASYAAAGSFVAHLLRTRGPEAVSAMYLRGSVGDDATIAREERAWHASLRARLGRSSERAVAKVRFRLLDRGLLSTRCGRLRARISDELADASRRFDFRRALHRCDELLAIDPRDAIARTQHAVLLARSGDIVPAEDALAAMPVGEIPAALRTRLHTVLGDAWLRHGSDDEDIERASAHFREALAIPQDDDTARALEVRLLAFERPAPERFALLRAVVEANRSSRSEVEVGARLALVSATSIDGVADYLLGRRLFNEGRDAEAEAYLRRALAKGPLPTERLSRELATLLRRVILSQAMSGDARARTSLVALDDGRDPRFEPFERFLARR